MFEEIISGERIQQIADMYLGTPGDFMYNPAIFEQIEKHQILDDIYGPFDNFNLENSHVIPALIHKCYNAKKNKTDFIIAGNGSPLRQFIYSQDLAKLILWAFKNYNDINNPIIMIPPHNECSILDIAMIIAETMNLPLEYIKFDTTKANGQFKKTADTTSLAKLNHNIDFTDIKDGLKNTIEWFCDYYDSDIIRL
jgi:GDP-L-fucose synthase